MKPYAIIEDSGELRRCGRTMRIAMRCILEAWSNPEIPIAIQDHHKYGMDNLNTEIMKQLKSLRLEGFVLNRNNNSLTFQGYEVHTMSGIKEKSSPDYKFKNESDQERLIKEYENQK